MLAAILGDLARLAYPTVPLDWLVGVASWRGRLEKAWRWEAAAAVKGNLDELAGRGLVPPQEVAGLTTEFFSQESVRSLLLVLAPRMDASVMEELLPVEGLERLDAAFEGGRGVVLLLSHLHSTGGFLGVMRLRQLGYDVRVALPRPGDPWVGGALRGIVDRVRGSAPSVPEMLGAFSCQFNVRPIVDALRANAAVAQTGDGWHSLAFVDADFLGRRLPFPTGVMSIARLTGAAVVPLFAVGAAPRLRMVIEEPFSVGREDGALERSVKRWVERLDYHVRHQTAAWQHWAVPDALETMAGLRRQSVESRLKVS